MPIFHSLPQTTCYRDKGWLSDNCGVFGLPGNLSVKTIRIRVARVDSIVRLVIFTGGGHGGDFCLGPGARSFLLYVANCAQNQSGENNDNGDGDY